MIDEKHIEAIVAGETIKECRKARGLSQLALSVMSDVSSEQICNIERGKINPTIATYIKLLNAMDYGFDIIDLTVDMTGGR